METTCIHCTDGNHRPYMHDEECLCNCSLIGSGLSFMEDLDRIQDDIDNPF